MTALERRRLRVILARRARVESTAEREQLRLLRQLRRSIIAEASEAQGYRLFRLQQMLGAVDASIARYLGRAEGAIADATRQAWTLGGDLVAATAPVIAAPSGPYDVSQELLASVVDVTRDQVRSVYSRLGTRLKTQIRQVTLGLTDPFEAIVSVARLVRATGTFSTPMADAERIVRTEVNRTFSMASHTRARQADARLRVSGDRLMKFWLSAEDARVRDSHVDAARRYSREHPIPINRPFVLKRAKGGTEELMHPHDPAASAENTVNCRCSSITVVVTAAEFAALKKAA